MLYYLNDFLEVFSLYFHGYDPQPKKMLLYLILVYLLVFLVALIMVIKDEIIYDDKNLFIVKEFLIMCFEDIKIILVGFNG